MPKKYIDIYREAEHRYLNKGKRSGYVRTLFSPLRHRGLNRGAVELGRQLESSSEGGVCVTYIKNFLTSKHPINNHSFASYLLDVLREEYPNDGWNLFDPKRVAFYQGTLYHGTSVGHQIIFKTGLKPANYDQRIDSYTSSSSGGIGISTSKDFNVAKHYSMPTSTVDPLSPVSVTGTPGGRYSYVYEIDYHGVEAFDIDQTRNLRNPTSNNMVKLISEVNVRRSIPAYCIKGCYMFDRHHLTEHGQYVENKKYNESAARQYKEGSNLFLQSVFYS